MDTAFVSRRGILDKVCAPNMLCAQDLYLVCRATMSPIAKGEVPADVDKKQNKRLTGCLCGFTVGLVKTAF